MRRIRVLAALASCLLASGCLLPKQGTPVYVDLWAGDFWSGKAMLLEVSADQQRCKVAVRDGAMLVQERWVACSSVHPRKGH